MVNIKDESAIKNLKEIAELTRDSLIDEEKNERKYLAGDFISQNQIKQ